MNASQRGLWAGFLRSAEQYPERPALVVDGKSLSYRQLREYALCIAATLQAYGDLSTTPLTAVFAHRSPVAFAGILGSLLAGNGYVPLNQTFATKRTQVMLERSLCKSIIVDSGSLPQLGVLLDGAERSLLVLLPELRELDAYRERWPRHEFVGSNELKSSSLWQEPPAREDAIAYLLFTSGSTGTPKGVMIAHRSVTSFIDYAVERFQITEHDIVSQMFDLTFDPSVFDIFAAWERGACVCCPSQNTLMNPGKFIQNHELSVWFSVPSVAILMKKLGTLKPNRYPSLRLSLFAGEPLPVATAESWLEAAPNGHLENLYGPTELTVTCTYYPWDPVHSPAESEIGIVPIGYPNPGMNCLVVDEALSEVAPGEKGELLMNGPQMAVGYWNDPQRTASAFVVPPSQTQLFYRTGDRVRKPVGNGPFTHLGRVDAQIKVLGHRVELGEVEAVVRETCGSEGVTAVGWPRTATGYAAVEVFIEGEMGDIEKVRNSVASCLPDYMVPRRVHFMSKLPRNTNNKVDRIAIAEMLGEGL